jgi:hypothetical protein
VGEITLSHLRDSRIVEDRSGFDSIELLRQLGVLRTLLAAPRLLGAVRDTHRRAMPSLSDAESVARSSRPGGDAARAARRARP